MTLGLTGKRALVTGSTRGIGCAAVKGLAERNEHLVVVERCRRNGLVRGKRP